MVFKSPRAEPGERSSSRVDMLATLRIGLSFKSDRA